MMHILTQKFTQIRVAVAVLFTLGGILYGVSLLPPLNSGGLVTPLGVPADRFESLYRNEVGFCRLNLEATNCRCFGDISGMIQAYEAPTAPGSVFIMSKQELARWQAEDSC